MSILVDPKELASFKGSVVNTLHVDMTKGYIPTLLVIVWNSIPSMATNLFAFLQITINLVFIGQLGDYQLTAAAGLGHIYFNTFGFGPILSFGNGLLNVASQLFGARRFKELGTSYQRALILNVLIGLIASIAVLVSRKVLSLTGVEQEVQDKTYSYLTVLLVSVFGVAIYDATKQLLISQNNFSFQLKLFGSVFALHVLWCWLFVRVFDLGFLGAPLAKSLTDVLSALIIILYCVFTGLSKKTWLPWKKESLTGLCAYFFKVFPMGLAVYMAWLFWEIVAMQAAVLGGLQLAIFTTFIDVIAVTYQIPLGFCFTIGTLIGNAMGENNPTKAKKLIIVAYMGNLIIMTLCGLFLYIFAPRIASIYSADEKVINGYISKAALISLFAFLDGMTCLHSNVLRMIGHEKFTMYVHTTFSAIGGTLLPILTVFVFKLITTADGLLVAYFSAQSFFQVAALIRLFTTDLQHQCDEISKKFHE
eukprot:TRINITY_DN6580_c0_g1_i2.p1 TRINITY_DN6580_c0_g1~~TRINITY_DN6580_c0_g1_i2.p1  ORF type:complete len:477 (+),score=71.88 TRINITY_DN6580_c0_g1_i2:43-1473(+)